MRYVTDDEMYQGNVGGVLSLARWALDRSVRFIYISGAIVYKNPYAKGITEDSPTGPPFIGGAYGASKGMGDAALRRLGEAGLALALIRPSSIYGRDLSRSSVIGRWLTSLQQTGSLTIDGPASNTLNFVFYSDVAQLLRRVIKEGFTGTLNCGGKSVSVHDLATICLRPGEELVISCEATDAKERAPSSLFDLNSNLARDTLHWEARISIARGIALLRDKFVR